MAFPQRIAAPPRPASAPYRRRHGAPGGPDPRLAAYHPELDEEHIPELFHWSAGERWFQPAPRHTAESLPEHIRMIDGDSHSIVELIRTGPAETEAEIAADEQGFQPSPQAEQLLAALRPELRGEPQGYWDYTCDSSGLILQHAIDTTPFGVKGAESSVMAGLEPREFRWLRRRVPDLGVTCCRHLLAICLRLGASENAEYLIRVGADFRLSWYAACAYSDAAGARRLLELGADPDQLVVFQHTRFTLDDRGFRSGVFVPIGTNAMPSRREFVGVLLEYGADPNRCCPALAGSAYDLRDRTHEWLLSSWRTPVGMALGRGDRMEVLQMLCDAGAEVAVYPVEPRIPRGSLIPFLTHPEGTEVPRMAERLLGQPANRLYSVSDCCSEYIRCVELGCQLEAPADRRRWEKEMRRVRQGTASCLTRALGGGGGITEARLGVLNMLLDAGHPLPETVRRRLVDWRNDPWVRPVEGFSEFHVRISNASAEAQLSRRQEVLRPAWAAIHSHTGLSSVVASLCLQAYMPEFQIRI